MSQKYVKRQICGFSGLLLSSSQLDSIKLWVCLFLAIVSVRILSRPEPKAVEKQIKSSPYWRAYELYKVNTFSGTFLSHIFWPDAGLYLTHMGFAQVIHAETRLTNTAAN